MKERKLVTGPYLIGRFNEEGAFIPNDTQPPENINMELPKIVAWAKVTFEDQTFDVVRRCTARIVVKTVSRKTGGLEVQV